MNPLIIGSNGHVAAFNPESGVMLWRTKLDTGAGFLSATGYEDVCVLVKDGVVYAGSKGHLFAINAANGNILWHNALSGFGHNDVTLAMDGVAVQLVTKVEKHKN